MTGKGGHILKYFFTIIWFADLAYWDKTDGRLGTASPWPRWASPLWCRPRPLRRPSLRPETRRVWRRQWLSCVQPWCLLASKWSKISSELVYKRPIVLSFVPQSLFIFFLRLLSPNLLVPWLSNTVWPNWGIFSILVTIFITKVPQVSCDYLGNFKNITYYVKTAVGTFWATFGKCWDTFYPNIRSHWHWVLNRVQTYLLPNYISFTCLPHICFSSYLPTYLPYYLPTLLPTYLPSTYLPLMYFFYVSLFGSICHVVKSLFEYILFFLFSSTFAFGAQRA